MRRAVDGNPTQTSKHGGPGTGHFKLHLGYDYLVKFAPVKAPVAMTITGLYSGGAGGNYIEANDGTYTHRFLHLKSFNVSKGQRVSEGQTIATSGNTGAVTGANGGYHLHHDVRKQGTAWNASFSNYIDWEKKIAANPPPQSGGLDMPAVGSRIQLVPTITRTTFRAGTTNVAGSIRVTDNTFNYTVRGYDSKFPGRIIINSKSGGGDGVALALYYVSGKRIDGWKKI